jgi:hypothetical protein
LDPQLTNNALQIRCGDISWYKVFISGDEPNSPATVQNINHLYGTGQCAFGANDLVSVACTSKSAIYVFSKQVKLKLC